jgi:hypothetical protein
MPMAAAIWYGYHLAALALSFSNIMLRRIEGTAETVAFWLSSGRWELILVSGMLSVLLQTSVLV